MKCIHVKDDGTKCNAHAMKDSEYCFFHDPNTSEQEKQKARSAGGKKEKTSSSLPPVNIKTPHDVVLLLEDTINRLRAGEIDTKLSNGIGYLTGQMMKAMEISDLKNRIDLIEATLQQNS